MSDTNAFGKALTYGYPKWARYTALVGLGSIVPITVWWVSSRADFGAQSWDLVWNLLGPAVFAAYAAYACMSVSQGALVIDVDGIRIRHFRDSLIPWSDVVRAVNGSDDDESLLVFWRVQLTLVDDAHQDLSPLVLPIWQSDRFMRDIARLKGFPAQRPIERHQFAGSPRTVLMAVAATATTSLILTLALYLQWLTRPT